MFKIEITDTKCQIQGLTIDILTGLSCLVEILYKENKVPKDLIENVIQISFMTEKEKNEILQEQQKKDNRTKENIEKVLKKIFDL